MPSIVWLLLASALGDLEVVATQPLASAMLILARDAEDRGHLLVAQGSQPPSRIPCDRLEGAWGLWVDDVDADGRAEAIVALRKKARFDPVVANRLHVYSFEDGRCVPAWRGTRLAGRFDAVATDPDRRGTLLVDERLAPKRHRVARYRWNGFGYEVEAVLWEGSTALPARHAKLFDGGSRR